MKPQWQQMKKETKLPLTKLRPESTLTINENYSRQWEVSIDLLYYAKGINEHLRIDVELQLICRSLGRYVESHKSFGILVHYEKCRPGNALSM